MGSTEMGRHWSTEEIGWLINHAEEVGSKKKNIQNACHLQKHTDDKVAKGECCQDENRAAGNPGPKPTNVATFAKKKKENSIMRRQDKQPPKTKKYFRSTKVWCRYD